MTYDFHSRDIPSLARQRRDIDESVYKQAVDLSSDGIVFVDATWTIAQCNPSARRLLGVEAGDRLSDRIDGLDGVATKGSRIATITASGDQVIVRQAAECTSTIRPVLLSPLAQAPAERLVAFATRDPGTGLLNQDAFEDLLARCSERAECGSGSSVLVLHIDHFGVVADTTCRGTAEAFLRGFADRLRNTLPSGATGARLYGGTFAALLPETSDAQHVAEALVDALTRPFVIGGRTLAVSVSIGTARVPGDASDGPGLLRAAEIALHTAQAAGGGRICACSPELLARLREDVDLDASLHQAIRNGELRVHYQPKIDWAVRRLVGLEALVRWQHPTRGLIGPDRFIPLAERSGQITAIGHWVMEEVCRQLADWRSKGLSLCPVAVNVSPTQLLAQSVEELLAPLTAFGVPRSLIEIEITESAMMDRLQAMAQVLTDLRAANVKVAIDDFGTGHSSLGSLRKLPINVFKIDRSFVVDIERSREACDIISTIIAMAKALRLDIVAEGVESEAQASFLSDLGARIMQGYLFSRPVPAETVASWLSVTSPEVVD